MLPPGWGIPLLGGLVVVAIIAVIGYAVIQAQSGESQSRGVAQEQDQDPNLPGVWIDPGVEYPDSAPHVSGPVPTCENGVQILNAAGRATCSPSNPPTSGPHAGSPARWGIYDESNIVPRENFTHNLEHGGVYVVYNCTDCDELVTQLQDIVRGYLENDRLILMTPYHEMEENTIALGGWSRLDKFPVEEFTEERVRDFIDAHERRFNPEGL